jgi:hypothetical protein
VQQTRAVGEIRLAPQSLELGPQDLVPLDVGGGRGEAGLDRVQAGTQAAVQRDEEDVMAVEGRISRFARSAEDGLPAKAECRLER